MPACMRRGAQLRTLSGQAKVPRFVETNAAQLDDLLVAINALVIIAIVALFALTFAENQVYLSI